MDTKQRIVRTALQVFLEKGYDAASLKEVARQAGVTKGGIYHYFESKEQLFREALALTAAEMQKWSASQFGSVSSAKEMLAAILGSVKLMGEAFDGIVGEDTEQHPYSFLEILVNAARKSETVRREMEAIYSQTRENMQRLLLKAQETGEIRSDIDCAALALEINALMEGILLLSVLDETVDLDTAGERICRNMWTMIRG